MLYVAMLSVSTSLRWTSTSCFTTTGYQRPWRLLHTSPTTPRQLMMTN